MRGKAIRVLTALTLGLLFLVATGCSKVCSRCGGSGSVVVTNACPTCSGTGSVRGVCEKCGGKGKLATGPECRYCGGTGVLVCTYRTGVTDTGTSCYIPSRSTYGYPTVVIVCRNGRLQPLVDADEPKMGRLLRSNPNRVCPLCGGAGQFPCSYCLGKGLVNDSGICPACNGQGETLRKCPDCKGARTLQEKSPCPVCKGTGSVNRFFG